MKSNHQKKGGEFSFARSRLNDVRETEMGGKEMLDLMVSQGLHANCLLLDTFSPTAWAIAREFHKGEPIICRPTVQAKHNSIENAR